MRFEDMDIEKLWELFPITFTNYNEKYQEIYLNEEMVLKSLIGKYIKRISHIGSTAIKDIKAKPIVDILIEIDFSNKNNVKEILDNSHYILMNETTDKISFNKGYTKNDYADEVFHIHIKRYKDCDELYFRDYLNDNPKKAQEYEKLKLELYEKYQPNRDLYTNGKTEFVIEVVNLAKEKYKDRY